jgi:hypothetical protein
MGTEYLPLGFGGDGLGREDAGGPRPETRLGEAYLDRQGSSTAAGTSGAGFIDDLIEQQIADLPTEEDDAREHREGIRARAFERLKDSLLNPARERFKIDALVDDVISSGGSEDVKTVVAAIQRMMRAARYQHPKYAPIDGAYLMLRQGRRP